MIIGILLALLTGCFSVLNRIMNYKLVERFGILNGTLVNYIVASIVSVICILWINSPEIKNINVIYNIPYWLYLGGFCGLIAFVLTILTTPKIPITYATIFILLGQLGTGIFIDMLNGNIVSVTKVVGVVIVLIGMWLDNMIVNKRTEQIL